MDMNWENGTPIPYDENEDVDQFWKNNPSYKYKDPFDKDVPKMPGFISDAIYKYRGTEAPTVFTLWTSLFILSSMIKREAWIKWGDGKLFPNMYIILVGPAGTAKKGTSISLAEDTLNGFEKHIVNPYWKYRKRIMTIHNQATPEAVMERLVPKNKSKYLGVNYCVKKQDDSGKFLKGENNETLTYEMCSEGSLILPELAVMISKSNYTETLVNLLMDLYDAKDSYEKSTKTDGVVKLKNHYLTMIGGTTPTGFRDSIPASAVGDGFLSRTIIAYSDGGHRSFPMPKKAKGAPNTEELRKRLAWIARNVNGEYTVSESAYAHYAKWYKTFTEYKKNNSDIAGVISRKDINVLKIAMLLKAQKYESGREIGLAEMKAAIKLLDMTYKNASSVVKEIQGGEYIAELNKISDYVRKNGKVSRRKLLRGTKLKAKTVNELLIHLSQSKTIKIMLNGKLESKPSQESFEEYYWNLKEE